MLFVPSSSLFTSYFISHVLIAHSFHLPAAPTLLVFFTIPRSHLHLSVNVLTTSTLSFYPHLTSSINLLLQPTSTSFRSFFSVVMSKSTLAPADFNSLTLTLAPPLPSHLLLTNLLFYKILCSPTI
jgi:hypothetical protein